ncbi:hypothetical protein YC2023_060574 [Brassica napus]
MNTDIHWIIRSNQPLTDDHCWVCVSTSMFLKRRTLVSSVSSLQVSEYIVILCYKAPELLLNCSE